MSISPVSRRTVLRGAAAGAAFVASGCTASPSTGSIIRSSPDSAAAHGPSAADWKALSRAIDGDVVRGKDRDFQQASELFSPRFDAVEPLAVVEATSAGDVSQAIAFAQRFGIRVRPKAGGHSYVGASTVSGGMVIDVGRIKSVHYHATSKVANVGAGAALYHVHAALAAHGRTIPTGTCPTVGAAGLTLGGGIGVASRAHGLTCDQLAGVTIVTADGRTRVATPDHERALFWACQGGGGGNFGIVTSMRFTTQRARRTGFFLLTFPWSHAPQVIQGWARRSVVMPRSSWSNLHLEASGSSTDVRVVGACRAGDEIAEADAMEAAAGVGHTSRSTFETSFLDGVVFLGGGTTSARQSFVAASDIIPTMSPKLAHILAGLVEHRAATGLAAAVILDPLTGAVSDIKPHATAFPWRNHLCDIQWYIGTTPHPSHAVVKAAYAWIDHAHHAVGAHSAGGYINYLEPRRALKSFYGGNYKRLRAIKQSVDPTGFFRSPFTVG